MDVFNPGSFADLAKSPIGLKLWDFLHEEANLVRMETATYLERPAIEPLSPLLLTRFGDEVRADRIKMMIGRMARQILERRGYQLADNDIPISRPANMFTMATRYCELPKSM